MNKMDGLKRNKPSIFEETKMDGRRNDLAFLRNKMSRKKLKGTIKRVSGKNTVGVEVVRVYHHPRYRKRILTSKVYLAHIEGADAVVGMSATIEESRPISKRKRWLGLELNGKQGGT